MTDEMLETALSYAGKGWAVIPLKRGGKIPLTPHGVYDATTDEATIKAWWLKYPKANIGVRAGPESNLFVLDIDNKNDKHGSVEFARLTGDYGFFQTYAVNTPNDGIHCYFSYPAEFNGHTIKPILAPGIDVKTSGYVVAPPSAIDGKRYAIKGDNNVVDAPQSWVDACIKVMKEEPDLSEWEKVAREAKGSGESICERYGIGITDVLEIPSDARKTANGYLLKHPIHGATGDGNLSVSVSHDLWKCFRCDSGGDPLTWVAVREQFIDCTDAGRLDSETVKKCVDVLRNEGLIDDSRTIFSSSKREQSDSEQDASTDNCVLLEDPLLRYFTGNKHPRFVPKWLADAIMENDHFKTFDDTLEIYRYNKKTGLYEPGGETFIRQESQRRLQEHYSIHRLNETVSYIRDKTYYTRDVDVDPSWVPLDNYIYDLATGLLEEYSPDVPTFFKLDATFVEGSPWEMCPRWLHFMKSAFDKDDIPLCQEIAGDLLYRDYWHKTAFMFLGDGDNGKSRFLETLVSLLGKRNVSTRSLQDLDSNRFAAADLYGKFANVHADISTEELRHTGKFKMLTGRDSLSAEKKHQNAFPFVNYARLLFSGNELPYTRDKTPAFYGRWILIEMPHVFKKHPDASLGELQADVDLPEKLSNELPGILQWSLIGLRRLRANKDFTQSRSSEKVRERWVARTDSLRYFVDHHVTVQPKATITKDEFYKLYLDFCDENGLLAVEKEKVGGRLPTLVLTETTRLSSKGKPRAWKNIACSYEVRQELDAEDVVIGLGSYGSEDCV